MIVMRNFFIFMLAFILAFVGLTSLSQHAIAGSNLQNDINEQGALARASTANAGLDRGGTLDRDDREDDRRHNPLAMPRRI